MKYLKVMFKTKSGASNFEYKIGEVNIANNYLSEKELDLLNRMVSAYLDGAVINALNMHAMKEWVKELDGFFTMIY